MASLMSMSDVFQPAIRDSIPKIVALLMHNDIYVCRAGANTLAKLSENGKKIMNVPVWLR
jgi:UDP-N-acetylglucosamine:LPS N-acetylglucosamine transferase